MEVAHSTYSAMALRKYRTLASGMARRWESINRVFNFDKSTTGALALRANASRGRMADRCTSDLGSVLFHAIHPRAHEQAECRHGAS